jgi:PAS domain S-box-containing protein
MSVVAQPDSTNETELQRLRTLYQLLDALTRARSLPEVYEAALTSLLQATEADRAAILMFDRDGVMRFKAWRDLSAAYRQAVTGQTPWPAGTNAEPIVVTDVLIEESLRDYRDVLARERIRAVAFVPVALGDGVFGKFMLCYPEPHACSPDEIAIAQAIAGHVAIATERARAEFAHAESEKRLQAILDNSTAVVSLKDLQGRYLLINRHFEELFHLRQADVVGRTDYAIFPREVADRFTENDRKVIAARAPIEIEERIPQTGGIHTYLSIKFPLDGPDGLPVGVCGIATDITDRKERESASRRLAAIIEGSGDAIFGEDLDGNITSWNASAERIFGYTAEEAIGSSISMLSPPDRPDEGQELLRQVLQGVHIERHETSRLRKDGQVIQVSLTISPLRDESGRIVGVSKIARDITWRQKAEEERASLLAREQEARKTAELLNLFGPRLLAELDAERLVQAVTDIAALLTGAAFGAFYRSVPNENGKSHQLYGLSGVSRDEFAAFPMPRIAALFETAARAGVVRCDDTAQDPRFGAPVRSYLAVPVVLRSGEMLGALFFGHSLPGRFTVAHEEIILGIAAQASIALDNARLFEQARWVQTELKRSNQELRRANQDLETFAYSASHDLQEPLRTIAISAQLLERSCGKDLPLEESEFLQRILAAANGMSALLKDLLDYTRATRYAEGPPPSVDTHNVLAGVLVSLNGMIGETGATVTAGELPMIRMHEIRLAQLFQNLIGNAIKYHGKEPPRVHVSAAQREGWTVFSVSDNGIGIEAPYGEQIFGLFKRLHSRDRYPGSGIGLAICRRIVEQYGGRIWLDKSPPHRGSTFCFSLPSRQH